MITFVNVFTVHSGQQEVAFERIHQIYTEVVQDQVGFVDATLLKSDDGTTVTAVAHWDRADRMAALWDIPRFQDLHDQVYRDAISKVDPHVYGTTVVVTANS